MNRRSHDFRQASGFSLIELLIVVVILGILASVAVIFLTASRRAANGASAVQSMRILSQAEASYSAGVGNKNYGEAQQLFDEDLIDTGLARACVPTPTGTSKSGYVAQPLEPKSGFFFNVTLVSTEPPRYTILAYPVASSGTGRTGDRTFFSDQTGVIRVSEGPTIQADEASEPLD
jgi:type IV pilus assembly protein PilA